VRLWSSTPGEEAFCDRFASSLLLPEVAIERCDNAAQLIRVQRRYDVSVEVAARAWAHVHGREVALFFCPRSSQRFELQWSNAASRAVNAWRRRLKAIIPGAHIASTPGESFFFLPAERQALLLAA
jgi:hypothetical protein